MSYDAGGIKYEIEVGTAELLQAEAQVNKSMKKQIDSFLTADKSVREFEKSQKQLGNTITKTGIVMDANNKVLVKQTHEYRKLAKEATKAYSQTGNASGALGRVGRNAGQAGIQLQQFVGQIQGGQDAMLAFGAQAADLGIVLGLPLVGAIAGIGAAVVGTLIPSLSSATQEIEEILPPIDDLIEKIQTLTIAQKDYVKAEVAKTIAKERDQLQEKRNRIESLIKSNQYLLRDEKKNAKQIDEQNAQLKKLRAERDQLTESIRKQTEAVNNLDSAQANNASNSVMSENATTERIRNLAEINKALDTQIATLGLSEREAALYAVTQLAVGETEKSIVEALKEKINAHYDEIDAIKAKKDEQKELDKLEAQKSRASNFAQGVINRGMSEDERFAAELEKLNELRQQGLLSQQMYDEAIVSSVTQRTKALDEQGRQQQALVMAQASMLVGSTGDIFSGIAEILKNSKGEQSKEYKAMFKISKGFAVAQAALNFATAISNASAVSPWYAKFAALAEAAAAGGQILSAVQGAQYSGARQFGGPVSNGKPYLVGERGMEMFVPNGNGQIINNKDLMGGGQPINVIVNNNAPNTTASTNRDEAGNIEVVINELSSQVSTGQGKFARALKQGTNTQFKASV